MHCYFQYSNIPCRRTMGRTFNIIYDRGRTFNIWPPGLINIQIGYFTLHGSRTYATRSALASGVQEGTDCGQLFPYTAEVEMRSSSISDVRYRSNTICALNPLAGPSKSDSCALMYRSTHGRHVSRYSSMTWVRDRARGATAGFDDRIHVVRSCIATVNRLTVRSSR